MTQLKSDIEHLKQTLLNQQEIFSMQLHECGLFSNGTCERVMEERYAEQLAFIKKLDKVKSSIPKRLLKKIDAYLEALISATRLNTTIAAYALDDIFCEKIHTDHESREKFIQAKQASMKAYRDLAKHLMLQKTLSEHTEELDCHTGRVSNLHRYAIDVHNLEKQAVVINDICDIERKQRNDKYKKIAGITLRVVGWGIIIAASIIGFNPAVSVTVMVLSIVATLFGELLNLSGKKLAKPTVSIKQMSTVRDSLLFFKKKPPEQVDPEMTPQLNGQVSNDVQIREPDEAQDETSPLLVRA